MMLLLIIMMMMMTTTMMIMMMMMMMMMMMTMKLSIMRMMRICWRALPLPVFIFRSGKLFVD